MREKLLETELDKVIKQQIRQESVRQVTKDGRPNKENTGLRFATLESNSGMKYILEKELVKLLFEGNREIIELIFNQFSPDDFNYQFHQELVECCL